VITKFKKESETQLKGRWRRDKQEGTYRFQITKKKQKRKKNETKTKQKKKQDSSNRKLNVIKDVSRTQAKRSRDSTQ